MNDGPQSPDNREWIPVAPAHPYGANRSGEGDNKSGATPPRTGRGLAISALALGLAAALTTAVATFYLPEGVYAGAALGLIAIVCGAVALARRQHLAAASIVGVGAGAAALIMASVVAGILIGQSGTDQSDSANSSDTSHEANADTNGDSSGDTGAGEGAANGTDGDGTDSDVNGEAGAEALLEWPANFASGGLHFQQGEAGPQLLRSDPLAAGEGPTPVPVTRAGGAADILLYVDYRCPYCVEFETANIDVLQSLVDEGRATVEIRPLAFVGEMSPQLSGAMMCVATHQPEAAWQSHVTLMSAETQHISAADQLASTLSSAIGGLDPAAEACITDARFASFAQVIGQWYTMSPVPYAVDPQLTVRGTPLAVVNGVPFQGAPSDGAAFREFLNAQGL